MQDFNFFSPYIEVKKVSRNRNVYITGVSLAVLLVLVGVQGFLFIENYALKSKLKEMQDFMSQEEVQKQRKAFQETTQKVKILNQYHQQVETVTNKMNAVDQIQSTVIEEISNSMPQTLFIKVMSLLPEGIQMQGTAASRVSIAEFEHNLKQISFIRDIHISSINQEGENKNQFTFTMKCTLKDVNELAAN